MRFLRGPLRPSPIPGRLSDCYFRPDRAACSEPRGREVPDPHHPIESPREADSAMIQPRAADGFLHLLVRDVHNPLAVHPDLNAMAAHVDAVTVPVHTVRLQPAPGSERALGILVWVAITDRHGTVGVINTPERPRPV